MAYYYTTNFCLNPNFQNGMTGYSSVNGATLSLDPNHPLYGSISTLLIETPGIDANEGVQTPIGVIPDTVTASASLSILGAGTVVVTAFTLPGNIAAVTQTVELTDTWQRLEFDGIACTPGMSIYLTVLTTSPQNTGFWISAIQIERESPAHAYCDGNQAGCQWVNPSDGFGVSFQAYQFLASANSVTIDTGDVVPVLNQGQAFQSHPIAGKTSDFSPFIQDTTGNPVGAFTDFSIFKLTDPDPAQSYVSFNNGGIASGTGSAYSRAFATFFPPQDYVVSGGQKLWKRAAYMATGFQFNSVPSSGTQTITRVQTEVLPYTTAFGAPSPSAYDEPRKIHTTVKPDRLNYCTNPSFENSTAGWQAVGSATLSQDVTKNAGNIILYDDFQFTAGTKSMKVTVNGRGGGCSLSISNLIVGNTYIISAYLQAGPGLLNLNMACEAGSASAALAGLPFGDSVYAYGTGEPYGGILPGVDLVQNFWYRPYFTFVAQASTETLVITSTPGSDIVYPTQFWVDAVLIELGQTLDHYFDGNFGTNFFWEGTANLSRSYWYDQFGVKQAAVINALGKHVPLGITFAQPIYKQPYTQ